jgi:hypothetical protein
MISIIGNAVAEVNDDCNINIVNVTNLPPNKLVELNVEIFPTTIIEKDNKEITRLKGTFPENYIIDIIYKLEKE